MKKVTEKIISAGLAAVMLSGMFQASVLAAKTDIGTTVDGIKGWSGNAVMTEAPLKTNDKAVKLDGSEASWKFVNDMGTEVSYSGRIIVSADFYAEAGKTLTFAAGGATVTVTGSGKWDTVSLLLNTVTGKYETFINNVLDGNGTMAANTAITGVSFSTEDLFYIDNIKAEQYDATYEDNELDNVFSDNFDGLTIGNINNQNDWVDEGSTLIERTMTVEEDTENTGNKYLNFTRTQKGGGSKRLYHKLTKTSKDLIVSARFKCVEGTAKMDIMLRQNGGYYSWQNFIGPHITMQNDPYWGGKIDEAKTKTQYPYIYEPGEWMEVKFVINTEAGNYNLFVNDKKINDAPLPYETDMGTVYDFGNGTTATFDTSGFDKLELDVYDDSNTGTWYMDDLKISSAASVVRDYTTLFEDNFENGFDVRAYDSSDNTKWRYGKAVVDYDQIWWSNSDNAKYTVTGAGEKLGTDETIASTNVLDIEGLKTFAKDTLPENRPNGTQATKLSTIGQQKILADFAGGSKNLKISADIYTANYFYNPTDTTSRRDAMEIFLGDSTYLAMGGGYVSLDTEPKYENRITTHTQNAWNKLVVDVDGNNVMSVLVNGSKATKTKTLTEPINYIGFAPRWWTGGWYYLDNVKVETYEDHVLTTDITKGVRKKLIENNIDEMYKHESADTVYTIEGIYYTRDGGKSVESKPRSTDSNNIEVITGGNAEYLLDSIKLVKNTEASNGAVYAAVYNNGVLDKIVSADVADAKIGDTVKVSFLDKKLVCTAETDAKFFVWNKNTIQPLTESAAITENAEKTVFIASDSIAAPYGSQFYPQKGWGNVIGNYFNRKAVKVENYAAGGRSSRSFYNENGRWNAIKANAKKGDYVLVSFAHNDGQSDKNSEYYTDAFGDVNNQTSYKYWLNKYRTECEELGLNMILISPIPRNKWENGKLGTDALSYHINAMREFAAEYNVPFVDLNTAARETVSSMGEEGSKQMYLMFNPADYADDPYFAGSDYNTTAVVKDTTHLKAAGADMVAAGIAAGLSRIEGIRDYIK